MDILAIYLIALVIFLALDAVWLGLAVPAFYRPRIGALLRPAPNWAAAGLFYALYAAGIVYFGVRSGMSPAGPQAALVDGALYGFFTYLTYNATNLAVLRDYDAVVAVVDTIWGTLLGAGVSFATVLAIGWLFAPAAG